MKRTLSGALLFSILLALTPLIASQPQTAPTTSTVGKVQRLDLDGTWRSNDRKPRFIHVDHADTSVKMVVITPTPYLPAGQISFYGDYRGKTIKGKAQVAEDYFRNPRWVDGTVDVEDRDTLRSGYRIYKRVGGPPPPIELSGVWIGSDPVTNLPSIRGQVTHLGDSVQITRISGGFAFIPPGEFLYKGAFTTNPSKIQGQYADKGFKNPKWQDTTLTVNDNNYFETVAPLSSTRYHWRRSQ